MNTQTSNNLTSFIESFWAETWRVFRDAFHSNTVGTTINDWTAYFENDKSAYELFYLHYQTRAFALIGAFTAELTLQTYYTHFGHNIEKAKEALEKLSDGNQTKLIDALTTKEALEQTNNSFKLYINDSIKNNLTVNPDIEQRYQLNLKSLDKINMEIDELANKIDAINGIKLSKLNLEDALSTFMVKDFALRFASQLTHFFSAEKFASLLIKEVGNSEKEMSDSLKGWLNFSAGLTFDYFEKITGKPFYVNTLDSAKFIEKFPKLSPKTLLGITLRGVVVGIASDVAYEGGYRFGKWIATDVTKAVHGVFLDDKEDAKELYEMEWFMESADTILPILLNDLSGDELQTVMGFNHLLVGTFKGLSIDDSADLFGGKEYKDFDARKVVSVYQKMHALLSGNDTAKTVKNLDGLAIALKNKSTQELFSSYRGANILTLNKSVVDELLSFSNQETEISIATRYAIKHLNPFILVGENIDYTKHNQNGELDLYSEQNPNGMTDIYIQKRFEMLKGIFGGTNADDVSRPTFFDAATEVGVPNIISSSAVFFGSDSNDTDSDFFRTHPLAKGDGNDFLFGGGGADKLNGYAGNDYLEGNADNDTLIGGAGSDILVGGTGDDVLYDEEEFSINNAQSAPNDINRHNKDELYGGTGNDTLVSTSGNDYLEGGVGDDTYKLYLAKHKNGTISLENKTLLDTDGQGKIYIDDALLEVNQELNETGFVRTSKDGKYKIKRFHTTNSFTESKYTLIIESADTTVGGIVTIKDWKEGDLGIFFDEGREYKEGYNLVDLKNFPNSRIGRIKYRQSNLVYTSKAVNNSKWVDTINTGHQDDVFELANFDVVTQIHTGFGSNIVETGNKSDTIWLGGVGSDFRWAPKGFWKNYGTNNDYDYKMSDDEVLVNKLPHDENNKILGDWTNIAQVGGGDDHVYGHLGVDIIDGGEGNDRLFGGGNKDNIIGGAGNDLIHGDGVVAKQFLQQYYRLGWESFRYEHSNEVIESAKKQYSGLDIELIDTHTYVVGDGHLSIGPFKNYDYHSVNFAYHNNDMLIGEEGDDIIIGEGGDDVIYGGDDNDIIMGDNIAIEDIVGMVKDGKVDSPELFRHYQQSQEYKDKKTQWLIQFSGKDDLHGGKGNDHIYGGLKSDYIEGNEGDDVIYGDADLNTWHKDGEYQEISGGSYNSGYTNFLYNYRSLNLDQITLGESSGFDHDEIDGGAGNDTIYGDYGDDVIYGGEGDDYLDGDAHYLSDENHGNDTIYGNQGKDTIIGRGGNDVLYGGADDDTLYSGLGSDKLYGETGSDILIGGGRMEGGEGFDTYHVDREAVIHDKDGKGILAFQEKHLQGAEIMIKSSAFTKPNTLDFSEFGYELKDKSTTRLQEIERSEHWVRYLVAGDISFIYQNQLTTETLNDGDLGIHFYVTIYNDDDHKPTTIMSSANIIEMPRLPNERGDFDDSNQDDSTNDSDNFVPPFTSPNNPPVLSYPLALDLNHNGQIDAIHLNQGIHFDLDGNQFTEQTSWVSGNDGFLVLDLNSNGEIDTGSELFGTDTLIQGTQNKARDGFEALAQYDQNQDSIINQDDAIYKMLRIWQDLNQDGISQEGEIKTLTEHRILAIELNKQSIYHWGQNQVIHTKKASFLQSDLGDAPNPNTQKRLAETLLLQVNATNAHWKLEEPNQIQVGDGNNTIISELDGSVIATLGNGHNTLELQDGNHIINTGIGNNTISTKNGNQTITATGGNNTITFGNGTHHIKLADGNDLVTLGTGTHDVTLGDGNNQATTYGNDSHIKGGVHQDVLITGGSGNTLTGGEGADTFKVLLDSNNTIITDLQANDSLELSLRHTYLHEHLGSIYLGKRDVDTKSYYPFPKFKVARSTIGTNHELIEYSVGDKTRRFAQITYRPEGNGLSIEITQDNQRITIANFKNITDIEKIQALHNVSVKLNDGSKGGTYSHSPDIQRILKDYTSTSYILNESTISFKNLLDAGTIRAYYESGDDIINGLTDYDGDYYLGAYLDWSKADFENAPYVNVGDIIFAGAGNDTITTGMGSSIVFGEDGDDTIIASDAHASDIIHAGDGDDTIWVNSPQTRPEDPPSDSAEHKTDYIFAGAGNDIIHSQNKNQETKLEGGDGNDQIHMVAGIALGGSGSDIITANGNNAVKIYGESGNDTLTGGNHHDHLDGGEGDDRLSGGEGNDRLEGGIGADTLIGGNGDDTYIADTSDTYLEEGQDLEGGYDTIHINSDFDLSANNFEAVTLLGDGNFNVIGDHFDNGIIGNTGNNRLLGGAGADYISAGEGDDHLDGGTGADTLVGGDGGDYYILDNEHDIITENFNQGIDTVEQWTDRYFYRTDESGNLIKTTSYRMLQDNIENLILKGDTKTAFGNELDNIITLNTQNNFVNAMAGNDTIIYQKGGGKDTIANTDNIQNKDTLIIEGYDPSEAVFVRVKNTAGNDMLQIRFKNNPNDTITLLNYFAPTNTNELGTQQDNKIDEIVFRGQGADQVLTNTQFELLIIDQAKNTAPKANKHPKAINAEVGKVLSVQFDADTIKDTDAYDSQLKYKLTLATKDSNGQYEAIPDWLTFDPVTRTLTGTPPKGTNNQTITHQFILWGEDSFNYSAGVYVTLNIASQTTTPPAVTTPPTNPKPTTQEVPYLKDINNSRGINNTYLYSGGKYTLQDRSGTDTLRFANHIKASQITRSFSKSGNDLILKIDNQDKDTLIIKDFFTTQGRIERMVFGNGAALTYQQFYNAFGINTRTASTSGVSSIGIRSLSESWSTEQTHDHYIQNATNTLIQSMSLLPESKSMNVPPTPYQDQTIGQLWQVAISPV